MGIRRLTMALLATAALGCTSLVLGGGPSQAAPSPTGAASISAAPQSGSYGSSMLMGVKALSPTDVWIVGNHKSSRLDYQPVMRHYDGVGWSRVGHLERPTGAKCIPSAVDARSDDDVWLSCIYGYAGGGYRGQPLIEHWDGTSWHLQDTAPSGGIADLTGIWEDGPNDVWAVGAIRPVGHLYGLVLHFDGTSWTQVQLPAIAQFDLSGVSGTSPTDVWAVGEYEQNVGNPDQTLTLHYDGTSWQVVPSPHASSSGFSGLYGVDALSPTDVWAVGYLHDSPNRGLVLRWNGTKWVDTKADTVADVDLNGVSARSGNDVWVVGELTGQSRTVPAASHWDGDTWTSHPPRHPGDNEDVLNAVSMAGHNSVWAVGFWGEPSTWVRMYQYWDGSDWQRHTP